MTEIQLNMYHALALGAAMYALGLVLTKKIPVFSRFCIPAPLVGGLCFAIFNTILYATGTAVITFDDTLQTVFMIFFFTTVGFTVSIPMLLKSGKSVIMLLILSVVMIILQNVVGSGVMALMGKDPLYGLACGSISMIGGPGTAAGIGPDLDAAGAIGGTTVAVAAATFGLIFGSLLGGPIARKLIVKNHLRNELAEQTVEEDVDDTHYNTHANNFVYGFLLLMFCAGVGNVVSVLLTNLCGFSFPIYIGSMLVAVVVRNVIDHFKIMEFPAAEISTMGNMFLAIFGPQTLATRRPGAADDRRPRRRGAADGRLLAAGRLPGHGPRLRRRDDHRRLHRLRHGRHVQRHGQHAGRFPPLRSLSLGLLRHPDGRRPLQRLLQRRDHCILYRSSCVRTV